MGEKRHRKILDYGSTISTLVQFNLFLNFISGILCLKAKLLHFKWMYGFR